MQTSPSTIAREALRQLAARRLPPTPDNYTRIYHEIANPNGHHYETATPSWAPLIRELVQLWDARQPGLTQARKREALDHVLAAFAASHDGLYARLRGLTRSWHQAAMTTARPVALVEDSDGTRAADDADASEPPLPPLPPLVDTAVGTASAPWRELLAQVLMFGVVDRLGYSPELTQEAQALAADVRAAQDNSALAALHARFKQFWFALELASDDHHEIQQGLLRILRLLAANLSELVGSDSWMQGQIKAIHMLTEGPIDKAGLQALERGLRDLTLKQGVLKHSLDQARDALKQMVSTFVDRLSSMADDTGEYHDRLAGYATRIERADNISELSGLVVEVMQDTRAVQADLARSRTELLESRRRVDEYQQQVQKLEGEMAVLSDRLHEDQLTQLLNRRGLARAFEAEISRADRYQRPLCLAVLDVDDFKHLNDRLGHQAGDLALVHLARIVRRSIRPTDVISRYGGEEFVILLPETLLDEAVRVMTRVQRELTKRIFLHNNERVLITFSGGVAQRVPGEQQEELIARADRALYHAKQAGKNRVAASE
ncbi:MAG TPA: GGDEF domain-containing protein [Casimicrobiaceae bacterium]|jgi:diguanylate cyclase|nr:GGDEF domain-containing protein [Casimicrobiaceae bacterium]